MERAKTQEDLGWQHLLHAWGQRCRTLAGARCVQEVRVFARAVQAQERSLEISEARELSARDIAMGFGGIEDAGAAIGRAKKGGELTAGEIVSIATSALGFHRLREHLERHEQTAPRLWQKAQSIATPKEQFEPILDAFLPDGTLHDHASKELGPLRKKVTRLEQSIEARAKALIDDRRISEMLQDRYWTQREERYVLPVKIAARTSVPGIVHGRSASGQTVFVEPAELVELNNSLKVAQADVHQEVRRILAQMSRTIGEHANELLDAAGIVAQLDVVSAAARLADDLHANPVTFDTDSRRLFLPSARHPLMVLAGKSCVANDIVVESHQTLVVSGPNAGGKTVVLKTVGLAVMMARYGLHVATKDGASIPWITDIMTAIGDSQSIESELSTFSAHLTLLREFLEACDSQTLLLVDEVCSATEPEQGSALAQGILESFASTGACALVTTHYERLKLLAHRDERFANASVGFDVERLRPTYRLHLGIPGSSAALSVARIMGIPKKVMHRSEVLAGASRSQLEELLSELSKERERLIDERHALEDERSATAREYERARDATRKADEQKKLEHIRSHDSAVMALQEARHELHSLAASLKRQRKVVGGTSHGRQQKPNDHTAQVDLVAARIQEHAPKRTDPEGPIPTSEQLRVGTAVRLLTMGGKGKVLRQPRGGKVLVQLGAMKTQVAVSNVRLCSESNKKDSVPKRGSYTLTADIEAHDSERHTHRLDLRGTRVDEALERVEQFIDDCLVSYRQTIEIVHGHGTGALRTALRARLSEHRAVTKWCRGDKAQGGDGVTVVSLDV